MKLNIHKKALTALLATSISLVGCHSSKDCEIEGYHLHRYEKSGLVRYLGCDFSNFQGYEKTDQVWYPLEEDSYLHFLEMRNNLLKIEDNELYIKDVERINEERLLGKSLHPIYRAYKIDQNKVIPSSWVDSLFEIEEEYPYFKEEELYEVRDLERNLQK